MEFESFRKNVRGLAVAACGNCSFIVVHELISVGRMSNVVDDNLCSFLRAQAANICDTLFRDEYMGIVFGVVNMGAHRNNCGDLAALSGAVAEEAGIPAEFVYKMSEGRPNIYDIITNDKVDLVVNTPKLSRTACSS